MTKRGSFGPVVLLGLASAAPGADGERKPTVLVQGGAGAVGNAAIQLARWSDATVITTVSSPRKAQLAAAAGADSASAGLAAFLRAVVAPLFS